MDRTHFVMNFSRRLKKLMEEAGYSSSRSKTGVRLNKLAEVSGCSQQMARRYVLGEALPEIDVTFKIAKWLNISPGWLLFGEKTIAPKIDIEDIIQIDPELLEYILIKSSSLFHMTDDSKELVSFIMDIINDVTHIEADRKAILQIIDMSINSARRFGSKDARKTSSN